jgi:hypothetical protein
VALGAAVLLIVVMVGAKSAKKPGKPAGKAA